ncbi:tetratricopeptide repeat protein [Agarivorans sp. Alg241-V36]|uniref:tetratricopeptide repeat protein n=1 Tax=Agarivorans sp. Alg241-V36 TaxID=2305992 RepID=UPI0013D78AFB|nr:tetratricopeptide repeat protein [Agarivorans sp. Alg241-V36]
MKLVTLLLSLLMALHVHAAGSGRYETQQTSSPLSAAEDMLSEQNYLEASVWLSDYLQSKKGRRSADAWNLLGFSLRKQGHYPQALYAYQQALSIKPSHLGALEYSGELYLSLQELARAEQNLVRLEQYCGNCQEQQQLKMAISRYLAE